MTGSTPPRWAPPASFVVAVVGLLDALYLAFEHFTASSTLACADNGVINCLKVTTSPQSYFLGIPVSVLGVVYFVAMTVLCLPAMWRMGQTVERLRIAGAIVGVVSVFYLLYVELFEVGAICLFCTGVHICALLLFGIIMFSSAFAEHPEQVHELAQD